MGHSEEFYLRVEFLMIEIERILEIDSLNHKKQNGYMLYSIFPAQNYARNNRDISLAFSVLNLN